MKRGEWERYRKVGDSRPEGRQHAWRGVAGEDKEDKKLEAKMEGVKEIKEKIAEEKKKKDAEEKETEPKEVSPSFILLGTKLSVLVSGSLL